MEMRTERIVLETDRHLIVGDLHLPKEGYRSRLSDYLNHGEVNFLSLVDAEIRPLGSDEPPQRRKFVAVACTHVKLAYPHGTDDAD